MRPRMMAALEKYLAAKNHAPIAFEALITAAAKMCAEEEAWPSPLMAAERARAGSSVEGANEPARIARHVALTQSGIFLVR